MRVPTVLALAAGAYAVSRLPAARRFAADVREASARREAELLAAIATMEALDTAHPFSEGLGHRAEGEGPGHPAVAGPARGERADRADPAAGPGQPLHHAAYRSLRETTPLGAAAGDDARSLTAAQARALLLDPDGRAARAD